MNQPQTHSSYAVVMRYGRISAVYVGRFVRDWTSSVQGLEALLGGASAMQPIESKEKSSVLDELDIPFDMSEIINNLFARLHT